MKNNTTPVILVEMKNTNSDHNEIKNSWNPSPSLLSKTGNAVYNDDIRKFIASHIGQWFEDSREFSQMVNMKAFVDEMKVWISSSKLNKVKGVESFPRARVSLGVTQALDQFHYDILISKRRLRIFRGEYPYNRDVHPFSFKTDFIDDNPLREGDAVVISCPFSATGDKHPKMEETLEQCLKKKIPLFIDMAWFGTCGNLDIDLSHPGITQVAFSLTKGLTCGNYRCGLRLSRSDKQETPKDRLDLHQQWNHSIHLNLKVGLELMRTFQPDTQYLKYRSAQMEICKFFNIKPSLCVHIATSQSKQWDEYKRDGFINRLNLRDAIKGYLKNTKK